MEGEGQSMDFQREILDKNILFKAAHKCNLSPEAFAKKSNTQQLSKCPR
jgi:hypothetical protein